MRSLALAALAALAAMAPARADATVGGPTVVEVVGYAPRDRKIYYLVRVEDASDALPRLWFVRTDGPHAATPIAVRSWYTADADAPDQDDLDAFERRLARLRSHVVPMVDTTARWELTTTVTASGTWHGEAFGFADRPEHDVRCELVRKDARRVAAPTHVTVYGDPQVAIERAVEVPGGGAGVVVLRYLGDPSETGYEVDTVVTSSPR